MSVLHSARDSRGVELTPLAAACAALVLSALPLFSNVAGWAILLFVGTAAFRVFMHWYALRMPSLALKVVIFGAAAAGIVTSYGSMVGVEPGLSILLVLVALKTLETDSERDFQVMVLLGYFLGLCGLFFSQDLLLWLYAGGVFVLLTAALIAFYRGATFRKLPAVIGHSGVMLAQATPIVVLLFLFFPRSNASFRFQFSSSLLTGAGMSDRLAPGSVAALALNPEVAFRVDFPDRNAPSISEMYWRGAVLWRGNGLTWVVGPQLPLERRIGQLAGNLIHQEVSLQPHGARWIFALDRPIGNDSRFEYMPGGYLQRPRSIFNTYRYKVTSQPENRETTLPAEQLQIALEAPDSSSPRVLQLIEGWRRGAAGPAAIVDRALRYFREEKFTYTLTPGTYGANAFDEFLFERRAGFCEHYAAAFATLMRAAGVPARVVIGYHGGELNNRLGKPYVIVQQRDAHAWAEVWLKGQGWQRVDPTEAIAPERISSGLASYLESRASANQSAGGASSAMLGWREIMRDVRLAWDSVSHQWDLYVLNFNEDEQRTFLATIGLEKGRWPEILLWPLIGIGLVLGAIVLWLRRARRPRTDAAGREWGRFCARLAAAGVTREPWEGPLHFSRRAAAKFAAHRDLLLRIAELYARLRYAAAPPAAAELRDAIRALPRLRG